MADNDVSEDVSIHTWPILALLYKCSKQMFKCKSVKVNINTNNKFKLGGRRGLVVRAAAKDGLSPRINQPRGPRFESRRVSNFIVNLFSGPQTNVREASPHKKTHIDANLSGRHRHISRPKSENRKSSFRASGIQRKSWRWRWRWNGFNRHHILYNDV